MTRPHVDQELIRELAALLEETGLTEIEVKDGDHQLRVAKQVQAVAAAPVIAAASSAGNGAATAAAPEAAETLGRHPGAVTSPMVGTAYRAPEPGAPPFVSVGDRVRQGDTLLVIEAMKTFNEIPAPRDGTVTRILVENGAPVEFGEVLAIVE